MRRVLPLILVAGLLGLGVGGAQASRRPSRNEAREIRADARLYLQGSGWRVSGIRISTVNGNYAKAAVQQGRYGPGGEMILRLRHGIWHEVFLGTSDFCRASAPRRVLRDLGFRC
jgi:hypothetical protein